MKYTAKRVIDTLRAYHASIGQARRRFGADAFGSPVFAFRKTTQSDHKLNPFNPCPKFILNSREKFQHQRKFPGCSRTVAVCFLFFVYLADLTHKANDVKGEVAFRESQSKPLK